jgi:hypothetical protein
LKSDHVSAPESTVEERSSYLHHLREKEIAKDIPVLTDDRASVEYYLR